MAINPNTDFTSSTLSSSQMNRFPRGIVALVTSTSNQVATTTETVILTASTFTAVANRYYRITYFEPAASVIAGAGNYIFARLRLTNASGTQYAYGQLQASGGTAASNAFVVTAITTLAAGSTVMVATLFSNTSTPTMFRGAGQAAYLVVEDLGPA